MTLALQIICFQATQGVEEQGVEGRGRAWKDVEGQGRTWKGVEGRGRAWMDVEGHGRTWKGVEEQGVEEASRLSLEFGTFSCDWKL